MSNREDVIKKARELGESLKNSDEYKDLLEAQKQLDDDVGTQEMLKNYDAKRNEIQIKQMTGQNADEDIKQLNDLERKIMEKESMQKYTKAEENFRNLVDEANQEIANAMGESPEQEQE